MHAIHKPVLLDQAIQYLNPKDGEVYIDATFGAGGYSNAILNAAKCSAIGVDVDSSASAFAQQLLEKFPDRFSFHVLNYANLLELNILVDGIVVDCGVSTMQLKTASRGFSFMLDSKLDMRMDFARDLTAWDIVNKFSYEKISDIIYSYGEETRARAIARKIVNARESYGAIDSTHALAELIVGVYGGCYGKIHPATKTFQALRIYVNDELGCLIKMLNNLPLILKPNARIVLVSFHSLEDKIIKEYFKENCIKKIAVSKYEKSNVKESNINHDSNNHTYRLLTKKPIAPTIYEIRSNPSSRSAKLRAAQKL